MRFRLSKTTYSVESAETYETKVQKLTKGKSTINVKTLPPPLNTVGMLRRLYEKKVFVRKKIIF